MSYFCTTEEVHSRSQTKLISCMSNLGRGWMKILIRLTILIKLLLKINL